MKGVIRVGDRTSHGGQVVTGCEKYLVDGKPIARVGDECTCPVHGHTGVKIVEGHVNIIVDGKPMALHGFKTSCGATLITSMEDHGAEEAKTGSGNAKNDPDKNTKSKQNTTSTNQKSPHNNRQENSFPLKNATKNAMTLSSQTKGESRKTAEDLSRRVPPEAKMEIDSAMKRTRMPNGDDKKGNNHEEGMFWDFNPDTKKVIVARCKPGPAYRSGDSQLSFGYEPVDPNIYQNMSMIEGGKAHIHPTSGLNMPSADDIKQAFPDPYINIVVSVEKSWVYFYNTSGVITDMRFSEFMK